MTIDFDIGEIWRRRRYDDSAGQALRGAAYAATPDRFVFCGGTSDQRIRSITRATLESESPAFSELTFTGGALNGAGSIPGEFLCVGDNGDERHSTDGLIWTSGTIVGGVDFHACAGGEVTGPLDTFVAVGDDEIRYRDGVGAWKPGATVTGSWRGVATDGSQNWIAVGFDASSDGIAVASSDGVAWGSSFVIDTRQPLLAIAKGTGRWCAVGGGGAVWISSTGASGSWAERSIATGASLLGVAAVGTSSFVAVASDGAAWLTENNGVSWAQQSLTWPVALRAVAQSAAYGAAACGDDDLVLSSVAESQVDAQAVEPIPAYEPEPGYAANDSMAADAVARLVYQFRSSS